MTLQVEITNELRNLKLYSKQSAWNFREPRVETLSKIQKLHMTLWFTITAMISAQNCYRCPLFVCFTRLGRENIFLCYLEDVFVIVCWYFYFFRTLAQPSTKWAICLQAMTSSWVSTFHHHLTTQSSSSKILKQTLLSLISVQLTWQFNICRMILDINKNLRGW